MNKIKPKERAKGGRKYGRKDGRRKEGGKK